MLKTRKIGWRTALVALALMCGQKWMAARPAPAADQPPPTPVQEQPEVLTRGPVHEAFAEPVALEPEAGVVAPTEPPADIDEVPPAQRPEGAQVVWVPGYWAWDADRVNYIWVSACWRAAVPNRDWVPGYWWHVAAGWEWVPGFWAEGGADQIEYLPAPPAMADVQPPGPPPSADGIWAPPCWYWDQGQYIRRNGYWLTAQAGWVWVPSHYIRTPRGHIFAGGHWDYALQRRGVLFAPVSISRATYTRPGFSYSPSVVVELGGLTVNLFAYPRYSHYYFGDYYDDSYVRVGIYPWFDCDRLHTWYDPIYQHERWHFRATDPKWDEHERHDYDARRADKNLRPARTYREMEDRVARAPEPQRKSLQVARPLSAVVASKDSRVKFQAVNAEDHRKLTRQEADVNKFRQDRNRWESEGSERPEPAPAADRRAPVTPTTPRGGSAAPSSDRNTAGQNAQTEHRIPGPNSTPEHKEPAASPDEHKIPGPNSTPDPKRGPVLPATERKEPVASPTQPPKPVAAPAVRTEPAASSTESPKSPPGQAKRNAPVKVKIPASPISGKRTGPAAGDNNPPARPSDEERRAQPSPPAADTHKDAPDHGKPASRDTRNDSGNQDKDSGDHKNSGDHKD